MKRPKVPRPVVNLAIVRQVARRQSLLGCALKASNVLCHRGSKIVGRSLGHTNEKDHANHSLLTILQTLSSMKRSKGIGGNGSRDGSGSTRVACSRT